MGDILPSSEPETISRAPIDIRSICLAALAGIGILHPRDGGGLMGKMQEAATEIENTTTEAVGPDAARTGVTRVTVEDKPVNMGDCLWWGGTGVILGHHDSGGIPPETLAHRPGGAHERGRALSGTDVLRVDVGGLGPAARRAEECDDRAGL